MQQLHRSDKQPDWLLVPETGWNGWQQLAARTHSIVTPGNLLTVSGLLIVLGGLWAIQLHAYWLGFGLVLLGRLADVADGLVADATGTKSPLGEKLDAGFDKLASLAAFVLLVTAHVAPLVAAVALLLPNLSNALLTVIAAKRNFTLHPILAGKRGMAVSWLALGMYLLTACVGLSDGSWMWWLATFFTAVAFIFGIFAGIGYAKEIQAHPK